MEYGQWVQEGELVKEPERHDHQRRLLAGKLERIGLYCRTMSIQGAAERHSLDVRNRDLISCVCLAMVFSELPSVNGNVV